MINDIPPKPSTSADNDRRPPVNFPHLYSQVGGVAQFLRENVWPKYHIPTPLDWVCPGCCAAIGAQCTVPVRDGSKHVDEFCRERVMKLEEQYQL